MCLIGIDECVLVIIEDVMATFPRDNNARGRDPVSVTVTPDPIVMLLKSNTAIDGPPVWLTETPVNVAAPDIANVLVLIVSVPDVTFSVPSDV